MPDVRMPDGSIIRNVPEGTTKSQLMARLQKQKAIEQNAKPYNDSEVALSSVVKGLAAIPDAVLNTPSNLMNLGKSAVGFVLNEAGQGDLSQRLGFNNVSEPPSPITTAIRNNVGLFEPKTSGQRVLDWTVQGLTGAALAPTQSASMAAKNMALGAGSGAVGGLTSEVSDNSILGMLASTVAAPALMAGAQTLKNNMPQTVTSKGRELDVSNFLTKNIKDPQAAVQQLRDVPEKPLVPSPDRVAGQPLAQDAAPPSKPTTAQILAQNGDTQLLGIEKALGEAVGIEKDLITARYDANATARQAQMERMIPVPKGAGADAVQNSVKGAIDKQQQVRDVQQQKLQSLSDSAINQTGSKVSDLAAGEAFRTRDSQLYDAQRKATSNAFKAVDPQDVVKMPVPKNSINDVVVQQYNGIETAIPAEIKQALRMIDDVASLDNGNMTYKQMQTLSKTFGNEANKANIAGDKELSMMFGKMKELTRGAMDKAIADGTVSPDVATRYRAALDERIKQGDLFEKNAAGDIKALRGDNTLRVADELVPKKFLGGTAENVNSFNKVLGKQPDIKQTAQDWLSTKWRESVTNQASGALDKNWRNQSAKFLKDYDYVLRDYPDLKAKLDLAIKRSSSAEQLAARFDAEMQVLKKETGARFFLKDVDPNVSLESFLKSKNRRQDGKYILALAKSDPGFRQSMNAAIRDHMMNMKNDQQRIAFIDDVQNQRLVKGLFGDKMLEQWQRVTNDAKRDLLRQTKNISRGSDTANKFQGLRMAGKLASSSRWAQLYEDWVQYAGTKERDTLRAEALLDPKKAADLIEKKANQPTFKDNFKNAATITAPQTLQIQNKGNEEFIDENGNVYIRKK